MIDENPESRPDEESVKTLYDQLDALIQKYVMKNFADKGLEENGDYVSSWALVVHYGNFNNLNAASAGYLVEAMPLNTAPHALKGLFREGIDWVLDKQDEVFDNDDEI